jgi:hypothetical protein
MTLPKVIIHYYYCSYSIITDSDGGEVDEISDKEFKKMVIRTINECKDSTKT